MSSSESTTAPESPIKSGFLALDLDKMTARNELRVTNTEQVFGVLSAQASVTQSKQPIMTLKVLFLPPRVVDVTGTCDIHIKLHRAGSKRRKPSKDVIFIADDDERLSRSLLLLVNKEFLDHVRGVLALGEALLKSPFVADKGSVYFVMVLLRAVLDRPDKVWWSPASFFQQDTTRPTVFTV